MGIVGDWRGCVVETDSSQMVSFAPCPRANTVYSERADRSVWAERMKKPGTVCLRLLVLRDLVCVAGEESLPRRAGRGLGDVGMDSEETIKPPGW